MSRSVIVTAALAAALLAACAGGEIAPLPTAPSPDMHFTVGPPPDAACTHHAAPDGDDANPGTLEAPWRTFQHTADSAQPGDVVCFYGGTYPVDGINITASGTAEQPITWIAAPGEQPVLDGQGEAPDLIVLQPGVSYLRISGFALHGFRVWGLSLEGSNRAVWLDHLDISGGEVGLHLTLGDSGEAPEHGPVEDVTLEDSRISSPSYVGIDCTPGPCNRLVIRRVEVAGAGLGGEASFSADGIGIERGAGIVVEDCLIHDNAGDGIDLNSRDWDGHVQGVVVRRNQVYRNHLQGIKLWGGGRMENNVIWGQGINPVMIGVYPAEYVVAHNTIAFNMWDPAYSARDYAFVAGYPEEGRTSDITLTLVNNIFAFNTGSQVGDPTGIYLGTKVTLVESGGNLFYSREDGEIEAEFVSGHDAWFTQEDINDGTWAAISGSTGDRVADPLFVSGWPEVDLRLAAGSPAIGAGLPVGEPADDAAGYPRGTPPDIGAYEAQ
jgi:hypothetical protein